MGVGWGGLGVLIGNSMGWREMEYDMVWCGVV